MKQENVNVILVIVTVLSLIIAISFAVCYVQQIINLNGKKDIVSPDNVAIAFAKNAYDKDDAETALNYMYNDFKNKDLQLFELSIYAKKFYECNSFDDALQFLRMDLEEQSELNLDFTFHDAQYYVNVYNDDYFGKGNARQGYADVAFSDDYVVGLTVYLSDYTIDVMDVGVIPVSELNLMNLHEIISDNEDIYKVQFLGELE